MHVSAESDLAPMSTSSVKELLQPSLRHPNAILFDKRANRVADVGRIWRQDTCLADDAVKHELRGNTTGRPDKERHRGVADRTAILLEGGCESLLSDV